MYVPSSSSWSRKRFDYEMCGLKSKTIQCIMDLGVEITPDLQFLQQCIEADYQANVICGFVIKNFPFKNKDTISPMEKVTDPLWNM